MINPDILHIWVTFEVIYGILFWKTCGLKKKYYPLANNPLARINDKGNAFIIAYSALFYASDLVWVTIESFIQGEK